MDERIGLTIIALDEAKALHRIEELDRTARLFAGQLALRATLATATTTAATAFDGHWITLDPKVRCRNPATPIDQRELERLTIGQIRKTRLLDRRDVDEHVFAPVIADDETESLLRVEEFDDALAFADHLGGHSAAATAAAETTAATTAAAETTAATAAITESAAAAKVAAITESATAAAAVSAPFLEAAAKFAAAKTITTKIFALVAAAATAIPLAPSIETHARPNFRVPAMT